ncbi:hypothetical protein ACTMU2_26965 [Cupriavidus basilensis]
MMRDIVRYELFHGNVDMSETSSKTATRLNGAVYLERFRRPGGAAPT